MTPQNWIFLRGLVRDGRHWGSFVAEFEQTIPEARVVMLDVPGNGALNALTSPTTVRGMVEHCRAQLQVRGVAGPHRILAVSMGAMLAAEWSHAYPDEVQAQVLINTSMRPFSAFYQRLRPANYGTLFRLLWGRTSAHDWERAILRMTTNLRLQMSSLAEALIAEGRKEEAGKILDLSLAKMPERNVPFDRILLPTVEAYYAISEKDKANVISERLFTIMEENLNHFMSLEPKFASRLLDDMAITHAVMGRLASSTSRADTAFGASMQERFDAMEEQYRGKLMELEGRRTTRMKF